MFPWLPHPHPVTALPLSSPPQPKLWNGFSIQCFCFLSSHSSFTPFRLPPPHSTQRTLIKCTKSNRCLSPHLTSPLSTILYCWQFLFFLVLLSTFLLFPSIMAQCPGFTPIFTPSHWFLCLLCRLLHLYHPLNLSLSICSLYNCCPRNFTNLHNFSHSFTWVLTQACALGSQLPLRHLCLDILKAHQIHHAQR